MRLVSPIVTIMLPVYNGEATIEKTIKSLLNQTFQNFELIICLDGCVDNSNKIVRSFNDPRIVILENPINLGLAKTLNKIVYFSNSNTTYLAMAEQDDYYYPNRLELQYRFLEENCEYGLVSGLAEFISDNEDRKLFFPGILVAGKQYPKEFKEFFLFTYREQIKVVNTCMMLRKSVHIENGLYFNSHFPNVSIDWAYLLRFCKHASVYGLHEPLVKMDRRSSRNSITKNKNNQYRAARELLRFFRFESPDLVSDRDYKYALFTQIILELRNSTFLKRLIMLIIYFPFFSNDKRIYKELGRLIKVPINKLLSNYGK